MEDFSLLAVTVVGKQHRFLGLDWSYLSILGFIGNAVFSMRFLSQWIASERKGESVIPLSFWYWSIAGSIIMGLYFIFRRDPVGILAYLPNSFIYFRNLQLIKQKQTELAVAASKSLAAPAPDTSGTPHPGSESEPRETGDR